MDERIKEYLLIYLFGAAGYPLAEWLYRGYSHYSMVIVGGIAFCLIYTICVAKPLPLFCRPVLAGMAVTLLEGVSGAILNLWLGLSVWDYSADPFQIAGQVCLLYAFLWMLLSAVLLPFCLFLQNCFHPKKTNRTRSSWSHQL